MRRPEALTLPPGHHASAARRPNRHGPARVLGAFASPARALIAVLVLCAAFAPASRAQQAAPGTGQPATATATSNPAGGLRLDTTRFLLQTSFYGSHREAQPDHNNHFRLINLEGQRSDNWLYGFAHFYNSFNQPSQYVYVGRQWRPFASYPLVHLKLTGGLLHGYKGEYRDKIPFNGSGVAPGLLPSIGISGKRFAGEFILFGTAGIMLTVGAYLN